MVWKPGQTGKPTGQPVKPGPKPYSTKDTSFTNALRKVICEENYKLLLENGEYYEGIPREKMAEYMAQIMLTGVLRLPTGQEMKIAAKEFLDTYWMIVNRVDGPPIQQIDQTNRNVLQFDAEGTIFDKVVEPTESKNDEVE